MFLFAHMKIKIIFHCSALVCSHQYWYTPCTWARIPLDNYNVTPNCTGVSDHERYRAMGSQNWKLFPTRHLNYASAYALSNTVLLKLGSIQGQNASCIWKSKLWKFLCWTNSHLKLGVHMVGFRKLMWFCWEEVTSTSFFLLVQLRWT